MNDDPYFSSIGDFVDNSPAYKLICTSMRELFPNKKNWFGFVLCLCVGAVLAYIVGCAENTVALAAQTCDILCGVQLSIFACIFAVYSILLAFLSDSYIKKLLNIDYGDGSSYFKTSTRYFESVLFMYFVAIILSLILKLFLSCMPYDYILTQSDLANSIMAIALLLIYYTFSLRVIYELKSTIYNTVLLFRASLAYKILSFVEENKTSEEKNDDDSD